MMDERKAERELLRNHWAMPMRSYRRPSRFERLQAGRRQWFVRMAIKGFVPAPGAKFGMIPFVRAALPEYFEGVTELTVRKYVLKGSRRYDLLAPNGFNPETCQRLRVRLDGRRHWVPVWVNARGQNAAIQILREHLPPRSYSVARPPL